MKPANFVLRKGISQIINALLVLINIHLMAHFVMKYVIIFIISMIVIFIIVLKTKIVLVLLLIKSSKEKLVSKIVLMKKFINLFLIINVIKNVQSILIMNKQDV